VRRHSWIVALASAGLRSELARPWNAAALAVFMAANNLLWFAIWVVFFDLAGELRGWTLRDVGLLYGVVATAYGIYAAFFGGARNLGLGASVIVAAYVAIGSLVFFAGVRARLVDQLFECFLTLSTMPQIGLPAVVELLLYTALPAAFVGFVPVEIVRSFSVTELGGAVLAAIVFPALAALAFRRGLRRYASGNLMVDMR
jgi:ABC-type uncharacterized transport system permease subunit